MDIKRVYEILNNKEKVDVEYKSQIVWIQNIEDSERARIGFLDNFNEAVVNINELVEK